jgi:cholesterol transport system auxiliary component
MKWFNKIFLLFLIFLSLPILFGACVGLKQPVNKIEYYTLEYPPPQMETLNPLPHVIRMDRFTATPPYNTTQIIYRDQSFKRNAYVYYRWQTNPGATVTTMLNRDIKNSGLFKAVLDPGSRFSSSHMIEGTVDEFFEWDTQNEWKAILTVSIILTEKNKNDIKNRILYQKTYRKAEICRQKKPKAVAEAMSQALSKISEELIKDIYDCLKDRHLE